MTYKALLFFFLLEYVRPQTYLPALNYLHLNVLVLYSAALVSIQQQPASSDVLRDSNSRMLMAFLGLMVVSIITSDSTLVAWEITRGVLEYCLLYWVIVKQATSLPRVKTLFLVLVLSNIAVALLTPQLLSSHERQNIASGSFLGDANDFSLSVNIAIALCLFLMSEAKARHRLLLLCALLFLVFVVVMTQSRGGTLALMMVGFFYWIKSAHKIRTGLIAAAAVVVVLALAPPTYWERMNNITNSEEGSAAGRLEAWDGGWRMALDSPLVGVGAGRFPYAYGTRYRKSPNTPFQTAHSIYFLALGELGFPGLIMLILIIVRNLMLNQRLSKEVKRTRPSGYTTDLQLLASLSAAMVAFAVAGAFLSALYYPHLYVLAGLSTAARRVVRQRQQSTAVAVVAPKEVSIHWALRPVSSNASGRIA
jgi:probable O-glycosylation ligase (exosortase A-associated)